MISDDDLQRRFDQAQDGLRLEPGSVADVRSRGERRTRHRRLAFSVAAIALVVGLGGMAIWNRPSDDVQDLASVASEGQLDEPDQLDGPDQLDPANANLGEVDPGDSPRLDESDLTYLGAFRLPVEESNGSTFGFGGEASAFNPFGDPASNDGFPGSLFLSGHPRQNPGIAEVAIPPPKTHDGTTDDLPIAALVSPFADITAGRGTDEVGSRESGSSDEFRYGGLEVVDGVDGPRLHWSIWQFDNVTNDDVPGHGHSSLDLAAPDPQGPWFLGNEDNRQTAGYVLSVPADFANDELGGRSLITGFKAAASTAGRSWGPPLFAYEPPTQAPIGERLDSQQIAVYPDADRALANFGKADTAGGAAWISVDDGPSALMTVGVRGLGEVFEGSPREQDCGINFSVHAGPYEPLVMFYDPSDLARAASGEIEPWELVPYRTWNPSEHLIETCEWRLTSVSFDASTRRVYIVQKGADFSQNEFIDVPVVHVFQL